MVEEGFLLVDAVGTVGIFFEDGPNSLEVVSDYKGTELVYFVFVVGRGGFTHGLVN